MRRRKAWIGLHTNAVNVPGNQVVRDEVDIVGSFSHSDEDFLIAFTMGNSDFVHRPGPWYDIKSIEDGQSAFSEQAGALARFPKIALKSAAADRLA